MISLELWERAEDEPIRAEECVLSANLRAHTSVRISSRSMNWVNSSLQLAGNLLETVDQHASLALAGAYRSAFGCCVCCRGAHCGVVCCQWIEMKATTASCPHSSSALWARVAKRLMQIRTSSRCIVSKMNRKNHRRYAL